MLQIVDDDTHPTTICSTGEFEIVAHVYGIGNILTGMCEYVGSVTAARYRDRATEHGKPNPTIRSRIQRHIRDNGGIENFQMYILETIVYDTRRNPLGLKEAEDRWITHMRQGGHQLVNRNHAIDQNERRRLRSKRFRDQNPGYMAQKSREYRARQRALAAAQNQT